MTNKEKRNQRRTNELGQRNPKCCLCGETDITMLIKEKSSLLEEHHIAGGHTGDSIIICRNCHAKLTDDQLDWPEGMIDDNRTPEMKAVSFFRGLAAILILLGTICVTYAETLYKFVVRIQGVK